MNVSKKQCSAFRANQTVNPLTGRTIQIGKIRHKQLMAACAKYPRTISAPLKGDDYEIPPMGPAIHWLIEGVLEADKHMLDFLKYIQPAVKEMENRTEPISKMWLNELRDILVEAKQIFSNKPKYVGTIDKLLERLTKVEQSHPLINDLPPEKVVALVEVKPSRVFIRGRVARGYILYQNSYAALETSLRDEKMGTDVSAGEINDVLRYKTYCDYLIKHKIFSHDDIYKRVYPGENAFDELKRMYTEYRKLYEKEKGKSPIGKWP